MYSKEESKIIRKEYWDKFKAWSGKKRIRNGKKGKWLMNETGIRQVKLKFHFDEKMALVAIEIDTRNLDKRFELWNKLEALKTRTLEEIPFPLTWDLECKLSDDKSVSRIYIQKNNVNIYNRECWREVNDFFYKKMTALEDFYLNYFEYLKYRQY